MHFRINSFLENMAQAWIRQLPLFVMLVLYVTLPTFFIGLKPYLPILLPQVILPSLLLCLIADRRRWLWWTVFIFGNLLWMMEMGVYFCQQQRVWSHIAIMVAQCSSAESGGFLSAMYPSILKALFASTATATVVYICDYWWRRVSGKLIGKLQEMQGRILMRCVGALLFLSVIYSPLSGYFVIKNAKADYSKRTYALELFTNACSWIMYGYAIHDAFFNPDIKDIPILIETMASTEVDLDNTKDSLMVIYVIGESFSRNRSSLYGYPYDTNPLMAKELADSSLIIFDNVISHSQFTGGVFRYMMSTYDMQGDNPFKSYPLLPAIMKKAGYKVAYFDNHSIITNVSRDSYCAFFLKDKDVRNLCLDTFNLELSDYDGDFVSGHEPLMPDRGANSFTIYHLMGQHLKYADRYPETYGYFTPKDYSRFKGLSDKGASYMSEYDNATRYNDYVIHSIINKLRDKTSVLIYSPDHGEEVFDYREEFFRHHENPITSVRVLFEVPVMIWMSESFRLKYPDIVTALRKNTGKAIYNSDLPHTILDIAGIRTSSFNPDVSLLREGNGRSHRHVNMHNLDYDASREEIYRQKLRYE